MMVSMVLDDIVMPYDAAPLTIQSGATPSAITFHFNRDEVMRITSDGVFVDPEVSVDKAASAVIDALDQYIRGLVASKDAEIARLRAKLAKQEDE